MSRLSIGTDARDHAKTALRTLAIAAAGGALVFIGRHGVRLLVGEYRPGFFEASYSSDLSYPQPNIVLFVGLLSVAVLAAVVILAIVCRRHDRSRLAAALIIAAIATVVAVRIYTGEPLVRCATDTYSESSATATTRCTSGSSVTRFELLALLGPAAVVLGALTLKIRRSAPDPTA